MNKFRTPFGRKMVSIIGQHGWSFSRRAYQTLEQSFMFEKLDGKIDDLGIQPPECSAAFMQELLLSRREWLLKHSCGAERVRALRKHWMIHRFFDHEASDEPINLLVSVSENREIKGIGFSMNQAPAVMRGLIENDPLLIESTNKLLGHVEGSAFEKLYVEVCSTLRDLQEGLHAARHWMNGVLKIGNNVHAYAPLIREWRTKAYRVSVYRMQQPEINDDIHTLEGEVLAHSSGFVPEAMQGEYDRQMDDFDNDNRGIVQLKVVVVRTDTGSGRIEDWSPMYLLTPAELNSASVIRHLTSVLVRRAIKSFREDAADRAIGAAVKSLHRNQS